MCTPAYTRPPVSATGSEGVELRPREQRGSRQLTAIIRIAKARSQDREQGATHIQGQHSGRGGNVDTCNQSGERGPMWSLVDLMLNRS